jgi:hypothetical protein
MTRITLQQVIERLQAHFGKQRPPKLEGPLEMILWENVAYLADDDRRQEAFQTLKKRVGTEPAQILSASEERRCIRAPMVGETAIHLQAPCFAGSEPHNEESSGASVRFLTGSPKDLG